MDLDVAVESPAALGEDIDAVLRRDPMGVYAQMDQRSRGDYQARVASWAQRSGRQPVSVAHVAIDLALQSHQRHGATDRRSHVGYFLTDGGIATLARTLGTTLSLQERMRTRSLPGLVLGYCALAFLLCATYGVLSVWLLKIALPWPGQMLLAMAVTFYAHCIIPGWFNMLLSRRLRPRRMPRMDFSTGVPVSAKTLVVIPCLLTSREGIDKLIQSLERLYRNNRDANAGYALLSDFTDAPTARQEGDTSLLDEARARISAMNERHGGGFVLLHRPRRWNPGEGMWMGWERKRGKLEELNAYLVGAASPFQTMHGDLDKVSGTRYVLTVDDDNAQLTQGAVSELAAVLSHPLNRPVLSQDGTRIEAGFVIIQPRGMIALPDNAAPSRLERFLHSTVEIETSNAIRTEQPVVDVDQDVFGQAVYVGKGIYDVEIFHRLTHGLIAENTILSHDVLEGGIVRAAVATDIILHETFAPTFYAAARRTHRWHRGDWQSIPWLFPRVRNASATLIKNPLSPFGRWKIFHNVVRMLFPIVSLVCFVAGWLASAVPGLWTLNLLMIAWFPPLVGLMIGVVRNLLSGNFRLMARGFWSSLWMRSSPFIFSVDNAMNAFDAAARATFRMLISRRHLLEWTASIIVFTGRGHTLRQYLEMMWISPAFALVTVVLVAYLNPAALSSAIPFALLWISAPIVAWWWSQQQEEHVCTAQPSGS
ncbi:hypothetical protein GGR60_001655 [Xanthomonas arboricola]|uniref:hypothetical protein n=1 Tax=Xanthomonas euroxanthea TaxID=2259622 RepID=UPI001430340F|nr:hypothetical protein [Xanthomonas euroxanthea]NJC37120.1 hypothetical protein [Xanthomonas euroxanthea]